MSSQTLNLNVDDSEAKKILDRIGATGLVKQGKAATLKGVKVIQDAARKNLSKFTPLSGHGKAQKGILPVSFEQGIRVRNFTNGIVGSLVVISNYNNQGNFLLPIFEGGSQPRYVGLKGGAKKRTKTAASRFAKGNRAGYRGIFPATNFFSSAINTNKGIVERLIQKDLDDRLQKLIDDNGIED